MKSCKDVFTFYRIIEIFHFPTTTIDRVFSHSLPGWYSEYASWSFALLDHAVTGGGDAFMRAAFNSPTVSC